MDALQTRVDTPDAVFWRWRTLRGRLEAAAPPAIAQFECRSAVRPSPRCPSCGVDAVSHRLDRERTNGEDSGTGTCINRPGRSDADLLDAVLAAPFEAHCRACLRPWPLELVPVLEPIPRAPIERDLAELATLGAVLRACSTHEQRIYLQLYLEEQIGGFDPVATEANRRWPRLKPPWRGNGPRPARWAAWTVRTVVLAGRQRILDQMVRRGLWRFS